MIIDKMNELKARLLEKCLAQQSETVRQLQQEIEEAQKMANDYGQPKDRYDAFRTKLMRQIELYANQLDKAKLVMQTLHKVNLEKEYQQVEFGALVTTNKQKLFISAGLGKIDVDGESYYAISPLVPIFNALRGRKAGEEVVFNGTLLRIEEIS